jgi:hypothetical protein
MPTYTLEQLREEGPPFAMALLLHAIKSGEPFVTYGTIADELEYQLNIPKIFPVPIGHVAGTLMNKILELDPDAPLINTMITRASGIPGAGVGSYLADRYNNKKLSNWDNVSIKRKKEIIEREREKIFNYSDWEHINEELFNDTPLLKEKSGSEYDYFNNNYGDSIAESDEHLKLKEWVAQNPQKIGLNKTFSNGTTESHLLSGDIVDVLFSNGNTFRTVEVKSCRSNDEDFKRGIYQCVKYREVKRAEHLPYEIDIESILITERELNSELKERAKLLGVKFKCVSVNKIV